MGSIIDSVLGYLPIALLVLAALILLFNSVTIAKGDEIITLERKWFGKGMPDGRTVALKGEVGVQARILGPGFHLLTPFIYKTKKSKYTVIATGEVGMITARTGNSIPSGEFYADPVECNLFQDGEAFLKNGGQKGPQVHILPPGEHRINPHLFAVDIVRAVVIGENQIGMVDAVAGVPCEVGRIFGKPVHQL